MDLFAIALIILLVLSVISMVLYVAWALITGDTMSPR